MMVFHTVSLLFKNSLHSQVSVTVGPQSRNPPALLCSQPFWSSLHDRKIECPFEDTTTVLISWQQSGGMEQGSPEGGICFESVSSVLYCFSYSQDPRVQESRSGKGNNSTHYHS